MTDTTTHAPGGGLRRLLLSLTLVGGVIAAALALAPGAVSLDGVGARPHAPDWAVLQARPPQVLVHLAAAAGAFLLGAAQLLGPKGTLPHRVIGWTWAALMLVAAVSSIFIRDLNHGAFSLIHILTGLTLVSLPMGLYAARRGNIRAHRGYMTGLFFGGLVVAGSLAFLPGRTLWAVFFG